MLEICLSIDDSGSMTVFQKQMEMQEPMEDEGEKTPVANIDEALAAIRPFAEAATPQGEPDQAGMEHMAMQEQQAGMHKGFQSRR